MNQRPEPTNQGVEDAASEIQLHRVDESQNLRPRTMPRWGLPAALAFLVASIACFPRLAGATGLGPIFPLNGGMQLATRPQGSAFFAETYNSGTNDDSEIRESFLDSLATNPGPFQFLRVKSLSLSGPDVAVNETNGVAVFANWYISESGAGACFKVSMFRFDTNGAPTTAISDVTDSAWSRNSGSPPNVRADMNRAGRVAVVYFSESEKFEPLFEEYIYAKLFNADGSSVAPAAIVNQRLIAYWPVVAVAPDGGAVAAWEDATIGSYSYSPGHDIYARRIDASGNPIGDEFRVNTAIYGQHNGAEIDMATNGVFAIVWGQSSSDADGVYLQRFNADGSRLGPELRVSPYDGTDPQVAMAADGRFVVAWQGQDDSGTGIFAQRFLADGSFYGATLWVNEGATNSQTNPLLGMADNGTFIVKWLEGTNHFARWIGWEATNQTQILGPRVQSLSPGLPASETISNVTITFDRAMNAASFTPGSVQVIDPLGRAVSVNSVQTVDNQSFVLSFAQQRLPGTYKLTILPTVQDAFGNLLDEDGDTIKGEGGADSFRGQFVLNSSRKASFPVAESFEGSPDALVGWRFDSWRTNTSQITTNSVPHSGARHLLLDSGPQSATLAINQPGGITNNAFLSFWAEGNNYELDIDLSNDGQSWHTILATWPTVRYTEYVIDLDQAAATNGVVIGQALFIRFRSSSSSRVYLDDVLVQAGDPPFGPKVIDVTPTNWAYSNSSLSSITVTFDQAIDPATFSSSDVSLKDPLGTPINPVAVSPVLGSGNTRFVLTFPDQMARGDYQLIVGPNIANAAGHLMNQNGDAANGTPDDYYSGIVRFAPREPYTFSTLAGLAGVPGSTDGTNNAARFGWPASVAVDSLGNVYVADAGNNTCWIRRVTPAGVVTTLAQVANSCLWGIAVDNAGNVYAADYCNNCIWKVTPAGAATSLAGAGAGLEEPWGLAVDSAGNVLVGDCGAHVLRKVTPAGVVTTLAGYPTVPGWADGTGRAARFGQLSGLAVDRAGNVYVAEFDNNAVRKVTPVGTNWVVTTLAGAGPNYVGSADGTGSAAQFYMPHGIAVDSLDNVFVADTWNNTIRKVMPAGVVTTLAGLAGSSGTNDGTWSVARFYHPYGVAVDRAGNLYVADSDNCTLRRGFVVDGAPAIMSSASGFGFNAGQFGFNLAGPAGQVVAVDASSDLRNWLPIWTNTVGAGALYFSDPQSAALSKRFYRARKQ